MQAMVVVAMTVAMEGECRRRKGSSKGARWRGSPLRQLPWGRSWWSAYGELASASVSRASAVPLTALSLTLFLASCECAGHTYRLMSCELFLDGVSAVAKKWWSIWRTSAIRAVGHIARSLLLTILILAGWVAVRALELNMFEMLAV